jgi:hypothetical protein
MVAVCSCSPLSLVMREQQRWENIAVRDFIDDSALVMGFTVWSQHCSLFEELS